VGAVSPVTNGTRATNAVDVVFPAPQQEVPVVGAPRVKLTYSGVGSMTETRVYAQVVDDATDVVLGNLVTPIPIVLDGQEHTIERPLELVSATLKPSSTFTLQIVANASNYDPQRGGGTLTFSKIEASLPVVDPAQTRALAPSRLNVGKVRAGSRRVRFRASVTRGELRGVRATLRSRSGRRVGRRRVGTLTGSRTVTVRSARALAAGSYRVTLTGRRVDGSRVSGTRRFSRR
jgi:ABC-2 type transport system ATP-binding protein